MSEALKRALRTVGQLVVSGALTTLVDKLAGGLSPDIAGLVLAGWQILVTYVHNQLEEAGVVPAVLKSTPTPPAI